MAEESSIYEELDAAVNLLNTTLEEISPTKHIRVVDGGNSYEFDDDDDMSAELSNLETSILSLQDELQISFTTESSVAAINDDDDLSQEIREMETSILSLRAELSETTSQASFAQSTWDEAQNLGNMDELCSQVSSIADELSLPQQDEKTPTNSNTRVHAPPTFTRTPQIPTSITKTSRPIASTPIQPLVSMPENSPDFCFEDDGDLQTPSPIRPTSPTTLGVTSVENWGANVPTLVL